MKSFFLFLLSLISIGLYAQDVTPPIAVCKNITVEFDQLGFATIQPQNIDGGSTDNIGIVRYSASLTNFHCFDYYGPTTVTLTVADSAGNTSTCDATVTLVDLLPPLNPVGLTQVIQLDQFGYAYVSPFFLDGGSEEGCLINITSDKSEFYCNNVGDNPVTLTYIDKGGNTSTTVGHVIIQDITPPVAIGKDISVSLNAFGTVTISPYALDGGSTDVCGIGSITASKTTFNTTNIGTNTVTITVTDINGNSSATNVTVTVIASTGTPSAVCKNITVNLSDGTVTITAADIDGGSTNYSSLTASKTTFTCSDIGNRNVTLTATNGTKTSSCTATVKVVGTKPTVSVTSTSLPAFCQGDQMILTAKGSADVTSYVWSNGQITSSVGILSTGTYTVTATNQYGCTATASKSVTYDKSSLLSAYTVIGTDGVIVKRNTINSGGVGVTKGGAKATFDLSSIVTAAATFVKASTITVLGGSVVTNKIIGAASLTLPVALTNTLKGKNALTVADSAIVTVTDSLFTSVIIGKNAQVTFTRPRIYATTYAANEGSTVSFATCTNVIVTKTVAFGINSKTNTDLKKVTFYVGTNSPTNEFVFSPGATFNGNVYAAGGEIITQKATAAAPTKLTGQFIAKSVIADEYTIWDWNTNCDNSCGAAFAATAPVSTSRMVDPAVEEKKAISKGLELNVFPNPTKGISTIRFINDVDTKTKLSVFNIDGKEIQNLYDGNTEAGVEYRLQFDGSDQPAGIYFYKLETNGKVIINKLLITK